MDHPVLTAGLTNIGCGLLFIIISLPLVRRKVPMNRLYGFRFRRAFESESLWLRINAYGGRQFIIWSVVMTGVGLGCLWLPVPPPGSEPAAAALAVGPMLICVAVAVVRTYRFAESLQRRPGRDAPVSGLRPFNSRSDMLL